MFVSFIWEPETLKSLHLGAIFGGIMLRLVCCSGCGGVEKMRAHEDSLCIHYNRSFFVCVFCIHSFVVYF